MLGVCSTSGSDQMITSSGSNMEALVLSLTHFTERGPRKIFHKLYAKSRGHTDVEVCLHENIADGHHDQQFSGL